MSVMLLHSHCCIAKFSCSLLVLSTEYMSRVCETVRCSSIHAPLACRSSVWGVCCCGPGGYEIPTHPFTHTRLTALFPGLPRWADTRKVQPVWILLKQETVSSISWAICKSASRFQTDNHASTPPLSFLQAGCPSCRPTNSVKALKAQWDTKRYEIPSLQKSKPFRELKSWDG